MADSETDPRETPETPPGLDRRRFLKQAGAVAGLTLASGYAALAPSNWPLSLRDPDGERGKPQRRTLRLPEGGFKVAPPATAAATSSAFRWRPRWKRSTGAEG